MSIGLFWFDTWQASYGGAVVHIYKAGTTTHASVYTDENLTVPAANPQTLATDSNNAGKWAQPLYVNEAVELLVDSIDLTSVVRPLLTDLNGEDASNATVRATGGSVDAPLKDIVARIVWAANHGLLIPSGSAATNTATINAAIGIAAGTGGGYVMLPPGNYPVNAITESAGVIICGAGKLVTTLQCQVADKCFTLSGDGAGFRDLTLDGVNVTAGSIGIFAKAIDEIVLENVLIQRFETGIHRKGGRRARWRNVDVETCTRGVRWVGDSDAGDGADGDQCTDNDWSGGRIRFCTTSGLELEYEDRLCASNVIQAVGLESNTGTALKVLGAQHTNLEGVWFEGNTVNLSIEDDSTSTVNEDNVVDGFRMKGGRITGGTMTFEDTCQNVVFELVAFSDVDITLTNPNNAVLALDCTEDDLVTIAGTGTKWTRFRSIDDGASFGITTDGTATKAWSVHLDPGQVVFAEAHVIGNQQNGSNTGEYHIEVSAKRAGATLAYDSQSANFTVGSILTGAISGCTARIIGDSDSGATGTLTLRDIVPGDNGYFQDNETITDAVTGSALANGTLSVPTVSLLGSVTALRTAREDVAGWDCTFVGNGPELQLNVQGAAATTVEWTCDVHVTLS